MPKRNAYDSDNAFVVDAPDIKKHKKAENDSVVTGKQIDDGGNTYWEISRNRRLTVSDFKGQTMVGLREYYQKDGKMMPGAKGISLTTEQFATFVAALPELETVLASQGVNISRPEYGEPKVESIPNEEKGEIEELDRMEMRDEEGQKVEERDGVGSKKPRQQQSRKANHEATDDEDEDE